MDAPLISIVIPCHNAALWLGDALRSAIEQTYSPVEVVVVDDGSTDNSLDIIKSFGSKIRWTSGPNRGPSAARNVGMQLANGEWIQFLDADDVLHPQKLRLSFDAFLQEPSVEFVWANYACVDGGFFLQDVMPQVHAETGLSTKVLDATYAPWAAMFRKKFLERVGPWNESLRRWVDLEYHARIAAKTERYLRVDAPLYFYRQHDGPRISNANRDHSKVEQALEALVLTRKALEESRIPTVEAKSLLFPFYLQLSRSAARAGDEKLFAELMREAALLRGSKHFHIKRWLATKYARFMGIERTSALIEMMYKPKERQIWRQ